MGKILVAEDEKDILDLIVFTMELAGHQVITAVNGIEAVEKTLQERPDLILMDVRMPKMTGYEACERIKNIEEVRDIPVIFLSAKGQEAEIQQGLQVGAIEYILKPFAVDELTQRVAEVLNRHGRKS